MRSGIIIEKQFQTDEVDVFLLYCLTTLTTEDLGKLFSAASKTTIGQRIHVAIELLQEGLGKRKLPNLLKNVSDIRHLKRTGLYRRMLQVGVPNEMARYIIGGRTLESFRNELEPDVFRMAKAVLNEYNARDKWTPFNYEDLEAKLNDRNSTYGDKVESLARLTVRTAEKARRDDIVISINSICRKIKVSFEVDMVSSLLQQNKIPFATVQRKNGYTTIYAPRNEKVIVIALLLMHY